MLVNQSRGPSRGSKSNKNHASSLVNKAWEKKQNKKHVKMQKQTGRMWKRKRNNLEVPFK